MHTTKRTVWLLRHGLRQDFVDRDWARSAARPHDTPLAREGHIQSLDTARFLADKGVQVIYASPFLRTVETACIIAEQLGIPVRLENGLCEMFKAEWFPKEPDFLPLSRGQGPVWQDGGRVCGGSPSGGNGPVQD